MGYVDRPPCGGLPPPSRSPRSLSGILSSSVGPVITKVPQNGGRASTANRAPTVLEVGSPRSRRWQIQCVVRSTSWFVAGHFLTVSSWARRGQGALQGYSYKGASPLLMSQSPPTFWRPHRPLPRNQGSGSVQYMNFGGHKYSVYISLSGGIWRMGTRSGSGFWTLGR